MNDSNQNVRMFTIIFWIAASYSSILLVEGIVLSRYFRRHRNEDAAAMFGLDPNALTSISIGKDVHLRD